MGESSCPDTTASHQPSPPLSLSLLCAASFFLAAPAMAQSPSDNVIHLNQAWSQEDREWYYHFSQGSAVLSYDIFLNLEAADSQDLFRSGLNSPRYGLVPEAASPDNPDGLPIGISKTVVATPIKGWPAGDYAGLTCAACHEGQLTYKGKVIRIEGGISQHFRLPGYGSRSRRRASSDPDRRGKIRPFGGAARSIDPGCEGQASQAN